MNSYVQDLQAAVEVHAHRANVPQACSVQITAGLVPLRDVGA